MNGIELIAKERKEQIEKHGYTFDHDLEHGYMTLLNAAAAYMFRDPYKWPFESKSLKLSRNNIDNYKKAGAFVAAAIDVLIGEPNTAAPAKTLQECKPAEHFLNQILDETGLKTTDQIDNKLLAAMEQYADQFKAPVKVVTDEEIEKEAYSRSHKMNSNSKLMYTQGFEDCGEWMRKQLTGE